MAGPGFRDVTRIAASRPEIWRDICLTNRTALLQGLEELTQDLLRITDQIRTEDASGIEAFFEAGRTARREVIGE